MAKKSGAPVAEPKHVFATVRFKRDRETKGTFKYEEVEVPGQPISIGSLYVKKHLQPTEEIEVEIRTVR